MYSVKRNTQTEIEQQLKYNKLLVSCKYTYGVNVLKTYIWASLKVFGAVLHWSINVFNAGKHGTEAFLLGADHPSAVTITLSHPFEAANSRGNTT